MELRGKRVILRPTEPADATALSAILTTPEVARWWPSFDLARVEKELTGRDEDVEVYAIIVDGRTVGAIQSHEERDPEFRHAGIDLFLAPDHQGAGIGPDAITTLARHLIDDRGHHRLTIDPAAANERAIRAYEKVGFRAGRAASPLSGLSRRDVAGWSPHGVARGGAARLRGPLRNRNRARIERLVARIPPDLGRLGAVRCHPRETRRVPCRLSLLRGSHAPR